MEVYVVYDHYALTHCMQFFSLFWVVSFYIVYVELFAIHTNDLSILQWICAKSYVPIKHTDKWHKSFCPTIMKCHQRNWLAQATYTISGSARGAWFAAKGPVKIFKIEISWLYFPQWHSNWLYSNGIQSKAIIIDYACLCVSLFSASSSVDCCLASSTRRLNLRNRRLSR